MDADVVFINLILIATSASKMPPMHSVCHLRFFCYQVDGRDQNKNNFTKIKFKKFKIKNKKRKNFFRRTLFFFFPRT